MNRAWRSGIGYSAFTALVVLAACQPLLEEGYLWKREQDTKPIREAAERGDSDAQVRLATWYEMGHVGWELSYLERATESAKWYRKAAEQGHKHAQWELGRRYETGRGVPQDLTEAMKWYRKAAEQGHGLAQWEVELFLKQAQRAKHAREAAEQGHVRAQHDLAKMYKDGRGVPKDLTEAIKWYRKAAEQLHSYAGKALDRLVQKNPYEPD